MGLEEELRATLRLKPKANPERLIHQRTLENLVRSKEFAQAERLKHLCIALEKEEIYKAEEVREAKIKSAIQQLLRRQKIELNALETKVQTGLMNLNRMKEIEYEKYLN